MALRLIEIKIPSSEKSGVEKIVNNSAPISFWVDKIEKNDIEFKLLLNAENTEVLLDKLEKELAHIKDYRIVLLPVETTLPRVTNEGNDNKKYSGKNKPSDSPLPLRVSREELYTKIQDGAKINSVYITMVILSSIVASIGILNDNVAIVIGAMVIAPLLGPNVALSLATTLGDWPLGKNALKTNLAGLFTALIFAISIGLFFNVNVESKELLNRTHANYSDLILALASGSAAALAFTSGISATLIGVMVAVALLPPLVTFGIFLGAGNIPLAIGALLLLLTNLISLNLAGVLTFIIQGIQPRKWWEAERAKKSTIIATAIWTLLIFILLFIINLQR